MSDADATRADELMALGDRIAELSRSIAVAEHEMMRLIADFDRRQGWAAAGFGSCAEWLAWRVGIQPNAARERVRTALALEELPETAAAMAAGNLSYSKARSLTRVATPDSEATLLEFAHAGSAANLERVVRAWKALSDREELAVEQIRNRNRRLSIFVDDDGSYVIKGRLEPEVGALVMRAIEAAGDALYRSEDAPDADPVTPAQRRADALGLVAERAFAAGFGEGGSGARAERYQVMLHVEPSTLDADGTSGRSELDGLRVTAVTSQRLACDAAVVRVSRPTDQGAHPTEEGAHPTEEGRHRPSPGMDIGRRTRTIPPSLRRALEVRDRGCRFPGCGCRFTDAHHIVHWADGGRTDLKNLVLLCRRHHRAVHEGGMRVCLDRRGAVVFFAPDGRAVFDAPRRGMPPSSTSSARPLPAATPSGAPYPGADRYRRDRDIPWSFEARAREALDSG